MKEENEAESAKPEWRDATTYTKGKERIQDTAVIMFDCFDIWISKDVSKTDNSWYMFCPNLGLEDRCLFKTNLLAAQEEALNIALSMIEELKQKKQMIEVFLLNNGK